MSNVVIGSDDGLVIPEDDRRDFEDRRVDALSRGRDRWLFVLDGTAVAERSDAGVPAELAALDGGGMNCTVEFSDTILVGASQARLFDYSTGALTRRADFDDAPGRETWHTPWGGPPDVRSLAVDAGGEVAYANVHVGGVLRWRRDDPSWRETMDINADVHQVVTSPGLPGVVVAAAAWGLGVSFDYGENWDWRSDGLHSHYCRAAAISGDSVFVSASRGPGGQQAALYRARLEGSSFTRCVSGLPDWFTTNVDTHCLDAAGERVVAGDAAGTVYSSLDSGATWEVLAKLPSVNTVGLLPVA